MGGGVAAREENQQEPEKGEAEVEFVVVVENRGREEGDEEAADRAAGGDEQVE
jgi:hypothetical protein